MTGQVGSSLVRGQKKYLFVKLTENLLQSFLKKGLLLYTGIIIASSFPLKGAFHVLYGSVATRFLKIKKNKSKEIIM